MRLSEVHQKMNQKNGACYTSPTIEVILTDVQVAATHWGGGSGGIGENVRNEMLYDPLYSERYGEER